MADETGDEGGGLSSAQQEAPEKTCEYCGEAIDTSDWYPVTKDRDDDGALQFFFFCGEACQAAWLREHSESV